MRVPLQILAFLKSRFCGETGALFSLLAISALRARKCFPYLSVVFACIWEESVFNKARVFAVGDGKDICALAISFRPCSPLFYAAVAFGRYSLLLIHGSCLRRNA